ncbi:MAG TPA: metallophosphoesterase [Tepidisphaeraceae bacterium]|nr:metallophosphoesterase [Tepidisphaeraceae bacterium]
MKPPENPKLPSRRALLRSSVAAGAMLAAGMWPGWVWADGAPETQDFTFICVNDLHYLDQRDDRFFEQMVRQMNATEPKADFCLIVGDLAEQGHSNQLGVIRDYIRELRMPAPVVVGNHDYLTQTDRRAFEQLFPDSINYTFEHKGWQFLAADTTEGLRGLDTTVPRSTLDWLGSTAGKLNKRRPTVLFTHFPMGWFVITRPRNADDVLHPLRDFNLQAVFNGHLHAYTVRHWGTATLTTDKCCSFHHPNHDGSKEKGYFVCTAKDGRISRRFVEVKVS